MMIQDKPVEIKLGAANEWRPASREIILAPELVPQDAAHEIAHFKLQHDIQGSTLIAISQERDAWMMALRKMDPSEIQVHRIKSQLQTYLDEVEHEFSSISPESSMAKRMYLQVINYAKERRRELN